jgi:hypothetical protein
MSNIHERLNSILEEISKYEVSLEEDPTLPHLGNRYLQKVVSQCRGYLNRVTYYYQEISREERRLKTELKAAELDLEFKTREKLADDPMVRKQPSISDREALAATMLKDEHDSVAALRVELMDVQESLKLIKFKHQELGRTSQDIKLQRMIVKDDAVMRMNGEEGYDKPQVNQDRSVPNGMPAPVLADDLNPTDLLNPDTRPSYIPAPIDTSHAKLIADFYAQPVVTAKYDFQNDDEPVKSVSYEDLIS